MTFAITRETYYGALFRHLEIVLGAQFVTIDRRVKLMEEMAAGELPALFMAVGHQKTQQSLKQEPIRDLAATVFLYAANPSQTVSADMELNRLVDALEAAIAPAPAFTVQTLGGIVHYCRIEGTTEVFPGPNGERAAAIVPIQMRVP
jgi:hypothetical protein